MHSNLGRTYFVMILLLFIACGEQQDHVSLPQAAEQRPCSITLPPGPIAKKYNQLDGAQGDLGCPVGMIEMLPSGIGSFAEFEGGAIYWKARALIAYSIKGKILSAWLSRGGPYGVLGFPTEDEQFMTMYRGLKQEFEHGMIAWRWDTSEIMIHVRH